MSSTDETNAATNEAIAPDVTYVDNNRVHCDGADNIRSGAAFRSSALGHPRIYLEIDEGGYADCGYCDRRFVLSGGPADNR